MQDDPLDRLKARKAALAGDPLERLKAQKAAPTEPPVSRMGQLQGGAESLMDASTLGVSGLAGDLAASALPWEPTFKELRQQRKDRRASVPAKVRIPLEIAGAVATPVPGAGLLKLGKSGMSLGGSLIKQAPQTAGFLARTGRAMGDAALQGGIYGAAGNLSDLTPEAMGEAAKMGLISAGVGGGLGALLGSGTEIGVRTLRRLKGIGRLDKTAFGLADKAAAENATNYGAAEASAVDTPAIERVIKNDKVIAPIAKEVQAEATYQGRPLSAWETLMSSYKRLSAMQRRAKAALESGKTGAVGYDPKLNEGTIENIVTAKQRALNASETPDATGQLGIPLWRKAVDHARVRKGELEALAEGADVGLAVGRNKSVSGGKLLVGSREAFLRKVPKMTSAEAEAALAGIMGRFPEQTSFTSSPLGAFGLVTSMVRTPLTAYRTMPIIRALEAKLGRGNLGQGAGDLVRGTSTRLLSSLFANKDEP